MTAWPRALLCAALLSRVPRLCSCTDFFGTGTRETVKAWRLVNGEVPSGNHWIVYKVEFFSKYRVNEAAGRTECHELLNVSNAGIVASGSLSVAAPARNAFFNNEENSFGFGWQSQWITSNREAWLGAVFPEDVIVKCVQLSQSRPSGGGAGEFYVKQVTLQRRQDSNSTWLNPYWEDVATWGQHAGEELVGGILLTLPTGLPPRFTYDGTTTTSGPLVLVNITEKIVAEEILDPAAMIGMGAGTAVFCCCLGCCCLCWRLNSTESTVGDLHAPPPRRSRSSLQSMQSRRSRQQGMPTWASYASDKISVGSSECESTFMSPNTLDRSGEADDPSFDPAVKPTVVSIAPMPTNGRFPAFSDWVASVSPKNGRSPTDEGSRRFNMFGVMNPAHPRSPLGRWNPAALHRHEGETARSIQSSNSQATAASDRTSSSGTKKVPRPPGPSWGLTDRAPGLAWGSPHSRPTRELDAQPAPQPSSQEMPSEEPTSALEPDEERPRISTPDSSTEEPRTSASRAQLRSLEPEMPPTPPNA